MRSDLCRGGCHAVLREQPAELRNYARIRRTPTLLTAILGVLALSLIGHLLVTSIRRHRHELATLKVLGFLRRQVVSAIAWHATTITAAIVIGIPVGLATGRTAWIAFATRIGAVPSSILPLSGAGAAQRCAGVTQSWIGASA